jgi:recombinational DNA repair protein RecT
MSENNQIVLADKNTVRALLKREDVLEQFTNILGKDAPRYMASVYMAVADSPGLQECSAESVLRVAMRCAAKKLSCDPGAKEGQLVPR